MRSGGISPTKWKTWRIPSRSVSAIKASRRIPSPMITNRTRGFASKIAREATRISSCPLRWKRARRWRRQPRRQPNRVHGGPRRERWVQEASDVPAAVDRGRLLGTADASRQRLFGHGVADADDRVALPRHAAFQRDVEPIFPARFRRAEREPVDRMDDCGYALMPGRGSSENTGLRAMRMHHLRFQTSEGLAEQAVGANRSLAEPHGSARASIRP